MPRRIKTRPAAVNSKAAEDDARRKLTGMEVRTIRPFKQSATGARVAAQDEYHRDFYRLLNRLRDEGLPETEVLDRMRKFRRDQHPAPSVPPTTITEETENA
jgi:hypothetical protein